MVIATPGQHWFETLEVALIVLLWPVSGMSRALTAIFNHTATERDVIKRAARAGALCMVDRTTVIRDHNARGYSREWWGIDKDPGLIEQVEQTKMRLHRSYRLKKEYCLLLMPAGAVVLAPQVLVMRVGRAHPNPM
jgi:hypothetical protein